MMQVHHKTLKHYENANHLRFLTYSCFKRLPLFQNDAIKDAYASHIERVRQKCSFRLIAWVIMPEHVHLLIWPVSGDASMSRIAWHLKRDFARGTIARWRDLEAPILDRLTDGDGFHFWQHSAGYDRNVFSESEFQEKLAYIHANPVQRGLVQSPTQWRWSSARWYAGMKDGVVSVDSVELPWISR